MTEKIEGQTAKGYMCITAFECDLKGGHDHLGTPIYPSVEAIKRERHCADECGIVEVEVMVVRIIQKPKF